MAMALHELCELIQLKKSAANKNIGILESTHITVWWPGASKYTRWVSESEVFCYILCMQMGKKLINPFFFYILYTHLRKKA